MDVVAGEIIEDDVGVVIEQDVAEFCLLSVKSFLPFGLTFLSLRKFVAF